MRKPLILVVALSALALSIAEEPALLSDGTRLGVRTEGEPVVQSGTVTVIDFEAIPHGNQVGTQGLATFSVGWRALVDLDAGGNAFIANEPSPDTAAVYLGSGPIITVTFSSPVASVFFSYSLDTRFGPVTVTARDAGGDVVGTPFILDVCGHTTCGNTCSGDPTGDFCSWAMAGGTIDPGGPGISSLEFDGRLFFMDDFTYETALLPGQATAPSPANNATNVLLTTMLNWTTGSMAESHDVYFGTNPTPGAAEMQGNQTATTFNPGTLTPSTTYYWRIDEVNTIGTTTGALWTFSTAIPVELQSFSVE